MNSLTLHEFEVEKNRKALLYTAIVCAVFLIIAFFYTWKMFTPPAPNEMDLIEINLGNEMEGFGEVQPLVKGDKAPDDQSIAAVQSSQRATESPSRQVQADEHGDLEAATVAKTDKPEKSAKDINKESSAKASKTVNPSPVTNPNPAPPKPKTVYKGGTGTGGNNAEEDNGYRNQGYNPGGTGDMGSPDGKPDSYGNSPGGRSGGGISISRGLTGRRILSFPNMKGDFNENAKVFVDVVVNASGKVISANPGAKGTTTSNATLRNIAKQKAMELKFNPTTSGGNETGTILFNFILEN